MKHPILMLYGENNNNMGKIVPQCKQMGEDKGEDVIIKLLQKTQK